MNVLTFDIEEWFHLLEHPDVSGEDSWSRLERRLPGMLDRILRILDDHEQRATFFCLGWVAREYPHLVRKIADAGHELGSHSDVHSLVHQQTASEFKTELAKSKRLLEDISGRPVEAFRAPGFSLTRPCSWAFEALAESDFRFDCSVFPSGRAHGGFPDFPADGPSIVETPSGSIKEFPMNVARLFGRPFVFSGGGYFRLTPQVLLEALWRRSSYTMTYFHPRDFEPSLPRLANLSLVRRFKSSYGRVGTERKLRLLLDMFEFASLGQAERLIDWDRVPHLRLEGDRLCSC